MPSQGSISSLKPSLKILHPFRHSKEVDALGIWHCACQHHNTRRSNTSCLRFVLQPPPPDLVFEAKDTAAIRDDKENSCTTIMSTILTWKPTSQQHSRASSWKNLTTHSTYVHLKRKCTLDMTDSVYGISNNQLCQFNVHKNVWDIIMECTT